jgi:type IV pilus assembly protein PilN
MITINLLPVREERRKASARQFLLVASAAVAASVALSAVHYGWFRSEVAADKAAAARIQKEIDGFAPQLAQVEKFRAAKADIERKLKVIDDLSAARSGPVHLFDEVATHLPERMWLTEMDVKGQALTIQGVSLDNELVALFLTAMNASPYFENVELLETQAREYDGYKLNAFEMSATLEGSSKDEAGAGGSPNQQAPAKPGTPAVAAR